MRVASQWTQPSNGNMHWFAERKILLAILALLVASDAHCISDSHSFRRYISFLCNFIRVDHKNAVGRQLKQFRRFRIPGYFRIGCFHLFFLNFHWIAELLRLSQLV